MQKVNMDGSQKKIAVVYKSKSGFTQKYAEWIANATDATLIEGSKAKASSLMEYDTIIYAGGLYAGKINGINLITNNYYKLEGKKLIVICVCLTPISGKVIDEIKNKNLIPDYQKTISFFLLRGGFDYNKLTGTDKVLMNIMKANLSRKKALTAYEDGMLQAFSTPVDFTSEKDLDPILKFLK